MDPKQSEASSEAAESRPDGMATSPVAAPTDHLAQQPVGSADGAVAWQAPEFIAHPKSLQWYGLLALVAVAIAALVYWLTKDKITAGVVIFAAIALGFYAGRKPRTLQYLLDGQGLTIDQKYYDIMEEAGSVSIAFLPLKRFGQLTAIYFDPEDEQAIVELLGDRLPLEDRSHDLLDTFMHRIKF
jgi:hypothetical protein